MYSHSVFLNYCVAYVYIDGLDSLNRTREIIYLSRCVCYRSIRHIIVPRCKALVGGAAAAATASPQLYFP